MRDYLLHTGAPELPFPPELGVLVLGAGLLVLAVVGYDIYRQYSFGVDA